MYNIKNKQFIFKQSTGKIFNFYYDLDKNLCCTAFTQKNTWSKPFIIAKNIYPNFFVEMCSNDSFHIIYQDSHGNLLYAYFNNEDTVHTPILKSKFPTPYEKQVCLIPKDSVIHFFFVLKAENKFILVHQTINNGAISNPKVIDYIVSNDFPYTVISDKGDNIYAFYQSFDDKHLQLGYKKFSPQQNFWGEFSLVSKYKGDCAFPMPLIDNENVLHICYQRKTSRSYELIYQQKLLDKNIWTDEIIIHASAYTFNNSYLISVDNTLIAYWLRESSIYFSTSKTAGTTWSKPTKYKSFKNRPLFCMKYVTNYPYENTRLLTRYIPGNFTNGLTLTFHELTFDNRNSFNDTNNFGNMLLENFKETNKNIENITEALESLVQTCNELKATQENLEKEVIKCTIRLTQAENQIKQLNFKKTPSNDIQKLNIPPSTEDYTAPKEVVSSKYEPNPEKYILKNNTIRKTYKRSIKREDG